MIDLINELYICNARIETINLGYNNYSECFNIVFTLKLPYGNIAYVGDPLDCFNTEKTKRMGTEKGMQVIMDLMSAVGVPRWEDLKGQYVRVAMRDSNGPVIGIGNIITDKWCFFVDVPEYILNKMS